MSKIWFTLYTPFKFQDYLAIQIDFSIIIYFVIFLVGDPKKINEQLRDLDPRNLLDLEKKIGEAISTAIKALNTAIYAIKNYSQDVEKVLDESTHHIDASIWNTIKEKGQLKEEALKLAGDAEIEANANIKKLRDLLNKKDFKAPPEIIERAKVNIQLLTEDLNKAKKQLEREVRSTDLTNKYWSKVKESREFFSKELETLFPNVNFQEQKLHITEGDLDVFMMHAVSKVLHYQKQIAELEIVQDARLKTAIEQARRGGAELLTDEQICHELEKTRRRLEIEFHDKVRIAESCKLQN